MRDGEGGWRCERQGEARGRKGGRAAAAAVIAVTAARRSWPLAQDRGKGEGREGEGEGGCQ